MGCLPSSLKEPLLPEEKDPAPYRGSRVYIFRNDRSESPERAPRYLPSTLKISADMYIALMSGEMV